MKEKVLNFLESDRGFASGKQLYGQLPGRSLAFNNSLNRMNDTKANCDKLYYELAKLVGITERHLRIILNKPLVELKVVKEKETPPSTGATNDAGSSDADILELGSFEAKEVSALLEIIKEHKLTSVVPVFEKGNPGMAQRRSFVKLNKIEVEGKKKADFDLAIATWFKPQIIDIISLAQKSVATQQFIASTENEKQSVKLHDQFPFLSEDDCPDVFIILVHTLVVTYRKYKAAHAVLFKQLTAPERLEAAKNVIVPYKQNKAIWAELEHYQTTGKPLGNEPSVKDYFHKVAIKAMNAADLAKLQKNLVGKINRNKVALEKLDGKNAEKKTVLINHQEEELRFVEVELKNR